ncbi:MAG: SDR family oxidoreductase [Acidobacteria bacterium]|nr:SDR family oxidoreductase [Acidobacteriota bacterium]MBW4044262.1 SDR family oxidoreductase [Acidobacteriota bacterium]
MVTGASGGLGRAIAHAFASKGCRIGLIARNPEALEATKREVEHLGGQALVLPLDVTDAQAIDDAATKLEETFGPIDVWVNDAMTSVFSPVKEMKAEEYKRVTEVCYLGYVYGTMSALRRMQPRDRGTIIQIGSALAVRSIPLQSAYCASKHAIIGFTDSLRCELHHDKSNVKLTVVQMPAMNTMQFTWVKSRLPNKPQPVPPIFEPEVAAKVVLHAAEAAYPRREYWVGTPTVEAIVGQKFIPGLLDIYLGKTGYKAQQRSTPDSATRPNNLWEFVPGTHSARGPFDGRSCSWSPQVEANINRKWLALGAAALAVGFLGIRKLA